MNNIKDIGELLDDSRAVFNLTSMVGYLNEYAVAHKLSVGLSELRVNVETNLPCGLKEHYDNYKQYMLNNIHKFRSTQRKVLTEIQRAEDGSDIMSCKILSEIVENNDVKNITVTINLTGKESSGDGKEDVVIIIKDKVTNSITDTIKASLKLYKNPSGVNVYNSTFASYLISVITDNANAGTGKKAVKEFLDSYPEFTNDVNEVLTITSEWSKIKTKLKNEGDPAYRKKANEFITQNQGYQKMRDLLFVKIFDKFYAVDKENINQRILKRLGLDGGEDVYLLVGNSKPKMTAVSSRTSEEFKRLYDNLRLGFNIRYEMSPNPKVATCYLVIESKNSEPLARFTVSFKEGTTFPHLMNMKSFVVGGKKTK